MSTMLHPVGPEPVRTYWLRRLVILGLGFGVLSAAIAVLLNAAGASVVSANPSPGLPSVRPAATTGSTPATFAPSGLANGSATPSVTVQATRPTTTKPPPAECEPSDIRITLTGEQKLRTGEPAAFAISLINGAKQACVVAINAKNFEVRIYSGSDRIWSTKDCARVVPPITEMLASEQVLEWQLTWDGRRSRAECKRDSEPLESGTYLVAALLADAKPVQLRMALR